MKTITKTLMTTEHHCLQLPYASLRLHQRSMLDKLVLLLESQGQLVPVVAVPKEINQWVLIDGYLRVDALRRIGQDIVEVEVWDCDVTQALLMLLTEYQSRTWETLEEAMILHELHTQHGLSQNNLANKIGRDQSWVCRRLSLIAQLPDSILQAVIKGKLSLWSATRVMAPMARAIPSHAESLLQHALKQPLSTREFRYFYEHYQKSNHQQRSKMVNDPDLFFKAQKLLATEKKSRELQAGPEGKWISQLRLAHHALTSLIALAPNIFTSYQDSQEKAELIHIFNATQIQFDLLIKTVRSLTHAYKRYTTDDSQSAPKREQSSSDQPTA
jgi:ParB family chromosome partitioning protein